MKKTLVLCGLLLLPAQLPAATAPVKDTSNLDWSVQKTWKLSAKPVDIVQTLDNKMVFVLGDDSNVHIYSVDGREMGTIPVDKNTTAIDIAPRGEMLYLVDSNNTYTAIEVSFTKSIDISGSPFLGNEKAPVTMVLFSDFQCPYCSKVQPLLDQVLEKNPDNVKIVFKNLPLRMHQMAEPAALAAIAAQNQGKFWQMHDALFATPKLDKKSIDKAAEDIGLDMKKFKEDMNSTETKQKLAKDLVSARQADVTGTPTLFVNGRRVKNRGIEAIQKMVDQEVDKAAKPKPSN